MRWDLVDEKNLNFLREGAFFHTSLLVKYFVLIWETGNERPISPKVAKITTVKEGKFRLPYEMKNCSGGKIGTYAEVAKSGMCPLHVLIFYLY